MRVAIYVSNHGFGHATRMAALAESFCKYHIKVYLCTNRPKELYQNLPDELFVYRSCSIDTGVVHKKNLVTDLEATKSAILKLFSEKEEPVSKEIEFLKQEEIDFVVADIPYFIVEACEYARVPVFGVSNFDWFFIYSQLFANDPKFRPVLNTIRGFYHRFSGCFALDFANEDSLSGFKNQKPGGLLVRNKKSYLNIRDKYNIPQNSKILLIMFGGEGQIGVPLKEICLAFDGVVISTNVAVGISNHLSVDRYEDFLSLLYHSDLVICKPGYSSFAEIVSMGKPVIYIPRENYPEEQALIEGISSYPGAWMLKTLPDGVDDLKELFNSMLLDSLPNKKVENDSLAFKLLSAYLEINYKGHRLVSVADIGSNSMNYTLFDKSKNKVIFRYHLHTGLGKDFEGKGFSPERVKAVYDIITGFLENESHIKSEKYIIATGINRLADDAQALVSMLAELWGAKAKIISAQKELRYSWLAANLEEPKDDSALAIDIGGASTEFSWLSYKGSLQGKSVGLGLLELMERGERGEDLESYLKAWVEELELPSKQVLVSVGLTSLLLVRYILDLSLEELEQKSSYKVKLDSLIKFYRQLTEDISSYATMSSLDRSSLKMASLLLIELLNHLQMDYIVLCLNGISAGYAHSIK